MVGTALSTDITLKVPDTPMARLPVFRTEGHEHSVALPPPLGRGSLTTLRLGDGLGLVDTHFTNGDEKLVAELHSPHGPMRFSFILSPHATRVAINGERGTFRVAGGQSALLSVPSGVRNIIPSRASVHNLCVLVDRILLESCLQDASGLATTDLARALDRPSQLFSHMSAITPFMQMVIEQILACSYQGGLRRLYLEAKCMELIAMRLNVLSADAPTTAPRPLSRIDIQRIHDARDLLIEEIADPPTLHEIAWRVGVNCNKLKFGFKQVFGTTVFGYLRDLRMEQARRLLLEGEHSVTEVAMHIGYRSLSHFARIFKQTYGVSPRSYSSQRNPMPRTQSRAPVTQKPAALRASREPGQLRP